VSTIVEKSNTSSSHQYNRRFLNYSLNLVTCSALTIARV
jgi:hypothetical protein